MTLAPDAGGWRGEPALTVTGGAGLTAVMVPGRGGKIVSLLDGDGTEWLAQPAAQLPPPARGGTRFTDAEMCGWDECVPTVDPDVVDGVELPGHGDAWTVGWQPHDDGGWGIEGAALPYRFTRWIEPTRTGLRLRYRVEATDDVVVPLLWAAHPQLAAGTGARIVLPDEVTHVVGIYGVEGRVAWTEQLAQVDAVPDGGAAKIWLEPGARAGWVGLQRQDGSTLRMSWSPEEVANLAIWVDAGMFARERVVALEPTTGSSERLSTSIAENSCTRTTSGVPVTWSVELEVARRAS